MFLIFDLVGGFTDMLKEITSIHNFTKKYSYKFTIRNCTSRPYNNPCSYSYYPIDNLINPKSFEHNNYYVNYIDIQNNLNDSNVYDFYKDKVEGKSWIDPSFLKMNDIINSINNSNKEYVIIGAGFWYYTDLHTMEQLADVFKTIIPSDKIITEMNKNHINEKYNCIHYRYENDWIPFLKKNGIPYIVPPIDELINSLPFTNNYLLYICTSDIENLHSKKLLYCNLECYKNIIYKKNNNLNYDENGFLDLLIILNCDEFYGNNISGFTKLASILKNTNNFYNKMPHFYKYNIIK
jgi:hypothetical protein